MNLDALGNLGEVVAAVATVLTLLYLTVQIRQNTKAIRATSAREILFKLSEWHQMQVTNPDMMAKFKLALRSEMPEFTNEEWIEMNSYCKTLFHILEAQYVHSRFQVGTGDALEPHLKAAKTIVETMPVWRKFWEEESATGHWTEGFVQAIDKMDPGSYLLLGRTADHEAQFYPRRLRRLIGCSGLEMNKPSFGSWLQISANLAILAGVVLVILQLRQNSELLEYQILKQDTESYIAAEISIAGEEYSKTWEKMLENPTELTLAEKRQIEAVLWGHNLKRWLELYDLSKVGLLEEDEWKKEVVDDVGYELANPFGRAWWSEARQLPNFPPDFVEFIDVELSNHPHSQPHSYYDAIDIQLKKNLSRSQD